jgi:hypothetical protein
MVRGTTATAAAVRSLATVDLMVSATLGSPTVASGNPV